MAIEAIGHVNIKTPIFAETVAFWEAAFGLVRGPAATMADDEHNAWLHAADGRALIHVNTLAPGDERAADVVSRLDHVAFDCSDLAGTKARLDAAGIALYARGDARPRPRPDQPARAEWREGGADLRP